MIPGFWEVAKKQGLFTKSSFLKIEIIEMLPQKRQGRFENPSPSDMMSVSDFSMMSKVES